MPHISTTDAANRLRVTPQTIRAMLHDGRLGGRRIRRGGRSIWRVTIDDVGRMLTAKGEPLQRSVRDTHEDLVQRVRALESHHQKDDARLREAILLLQSVAEQQRGAIDLQNQANSKLHTALEEQGRIISTLMIPDFADLDLDAREVR